MNTNIDERGAQAASRLRTLVENSNLLLYEGRPVAPVREGRSQPMVRPSLAAFAGAFVAVIVLVGLFTTQTWVFAPDRAAITTATTIVPSTITTEASPESTLAAPAPTTPPTTPPVDTTPPRLEITSPPDGHVSEEKTITFSGLTEPGAVVTAGPYEALVTEDGTWSIRLVLSVGENRARFVAMDEAGNTSEASVVVLYQPPTTTEPASEFSANFTWGSCDSAPPFDEYYGTAKPGSVVTISSEFGGGSAAVAESGEWYVKVVFAEALYGVTFPVTVRDQFGHERVFEFTSYAG